MLDPMLFDKDVIRRHGAKNRARGFHILMNSLFLSCAQDIAKLSMDTDDRAPSVQNLMRVLADDSLRKECRTRYANWAITPINESDPEVVAALQEMQVKEHTERGDQFGK